MRNYTEETKNQVRMLRVAGLSLNQIQTQINIPRSTIQDWLRGTIQKPEHKELIKREMLRVLQEGRIKAQKAQKEERIALEEKLLHKGIQDIGNLNSRDLFIAGIALYWAEGFKNRHERRLGFCNSDPNMIRFYIYWLQNCLGIEAKDLIARLTLNKTYHHKTRKIEVYWSGITGIPISQFTKPFYQNSIWKKQFNTDSYNGVLRIHVKDSLEHLLKMRGWIQGLKISLPG